MVTKKLGTGAQATVYSAHVDRELAEGQAHESVAIKVFNNRSISKQTLDELKSEAQVHEVLAGHPHIMPLLASYIDNKTTPIVRVPRSIPKDDRDQFAQWRRGHEQIEG